MIKKLLNVLFVSGLLSFCWVFSSLALAVDADKDALPDEWEAAHGRNTSYADYGIAINKSDSSLCVRTDVNNCANISLQTEDDTSGYGVRIVQEGSCLVFIGIAKYYHSLKDIFCSVTGSRSISCYAQYITTASSTGPGGQTTGLPACSSLNHVSPAVVVNTLADIGHIAISVNKVCAMTTRGVQCWAAVINGKATSLSLNAQGLLSYPIDPDGDGIMSDIDLLPLDVDTDGDGMGNDADIDDDNDGVPDYLDPEPVNPANSSVWPLNNNYQGSAVNESQTVQ